MAPSTRLPDWDSIKFFAIFCVVAGHIGNFFPKDPVIGTVQLWVYFFHMPLFIFISGLFAKKAVKQCSWRRALSYLVLYVLMELLFFGVSALVNGSENASLDLLSEHGVPWYGLAMVWWLLLTILLQKAPPAAVLTITLLLSLLSGYTQLLGAFLVLQRTLIFYPFFYVGWLVSPSALQKRFRQTGFRVLSAVLLAVSLLLSLRYYEQLRPWRALFRGRYAYRDIAVQLDPAWGFLWRLAMYAVAALLLLAVCSVAAWLLRPFSKLGTRTLSVFVFHYPVLTLLFHYLPDAKTWLTAEHTSVKLVILTLLILLLTSLPPLEQLVRWLMELSEGTRKRTAEQSDR